MACKKDCNKDKAQTQDTKPVESAAVTEQDTEQVTGGSSSDPMYYPTDSGVSK